MVNERINLLGLDAAALRAYVEALGEKPFRARQLLRWIHQLGEADFSRMSDLGRSLRERLSTEACVAAPQALGDATSEDGTRKWRVHVEGGSAIETVFIPESDRGTLCISSQAGCVLDCAFCATGKQGFNRDLSAAEIVGQLWMARRTLGCGRDAQGRRDSSARVISNVVLMGMGEPLANVENVIPALRLMISEQAYGLSRRRVTVSTSGLVPGIDRLAEACPVALAVSLHAPDDALRDRLVPINRKYPIAELIAACNRYLKRAPRDFITFEYVMLEDVNDAPEQAHALIELSRRVRCKINLIPFNAFPGTEFRRSAPERVRRFAEILQRADLTVTTRKTRGDGIDAACGQLAGAIRDRTRRSQTLVRRIAPPIRQETNV